MTFCSADCPECKTMMAGYEAGKQLSSATKGTERELFVQTLLTQVFSPAYRFGTGDITGIANQRSGQVDIVVESPYWYSLPIHPNGPRLYMAEGVAAIIEVKSDLAAQWSEVKSTVESVKQVQRRYRKHLYDDMAKSFESFTSFLNKTPPKGTGRKKEQRELLKMLKKEASNSDDRPAIFRATPWDLLVGSQRKRSKIISTHCQNLKAH